MFFSRMCRPLIRLLLTNMHCLHKPSVLMFRSNSARLSFFYCNHSDLITKAVIITMCPFGVTDRFTFSFKHVCYTAFDLSDFTIPPPIDGFPKQKIRPACKSLICILYNCCIFLNIRSDTVARDLNALTS